MIKKDTLNNLLSTGYHEVFGEFGFYFALQQIVNNQLNIIWLKAINCSNVLHPNSLAAYQLNIQNITFITYQNEQDAYWILEETLRSGAVGLTIIEGVKQPNLLQSRRLNMAAQKGKSKALILLNGMSKNANSAMSR